MVPFPSRKQVFGMMLALPATSFTVAFFIFPTVLLFVYSFWTSRAYELIPAFVVTNYLRALGNIGFYTVMWSSLKIGLLTAIASVALSFPMALFIVYRQRSNAILYLVLSSWLTSYLVRIYGWRMILGSNGLVNNLLVQAGIVDEPLSFLLYNQTAVILALVHIYMPVALLMLVSALRDVDRDYLDAARDLGAGRFALFTAVVLPMIYRGLVGAFMFTLILAAGDYIAPQFLGGRDGVTVGLLISNQFRQAGNWPFGASIAFIAFAMFLAVYILLTIGLRLAGLAPFTRKER